MTQAQQDYENLHKISKHARVLSGIAHLLEWDHETYMPSGAAPIRAVQLEALAGIIHSEKTGKKFSAALTKLIDIPNGKLKTKGLSQAHQAALREWRHDYLKAKALPKKFVEEWAKLTSQAMLAWRDAKKSNAFHHFAPFLDKLVIMARQKADFLGYDDHPYDALLDEYEPGSTSEEIGKLFFHLKQSITALLRKITKAKPIDDAFLHGNFSHEKQVNFSKKLLADMGYNFTYGRLDFSAHPFSMAPHPTDSRITTRFHPTSLMSCISVVLHEAGHALYEMGLPVEQYGSPLGDAISLGMHESQSRWWETRIGQSKPFWKHYLPLLKKEFEGLANVSLDTFYKAINKVEPSLIRVDADEVTYPLHVILRFELEKALIEGSLKIRDIPEAWNTKMQELLGITPSSNSEGCLQDVHWSMGGFGYFPTYTLGNMYAAHLFEGFAKEHPNWEKRVAEGDLLFITEWLKQAVHQHGRRYTSLDLLKKVTGKKFDSEPYIKYLTTKYSEIYK